MTPRTTHRTTAAAASIAIACAALFGATAATAQSTGAAPAAAQAAASLNNDDRDFIQKAGISGMAEVELGKLAQQRGADAQVKSFGEKMVQDHSKAGDELARLAAAKGVQIPPMDRKHKNAAEKLGKKSGADFDRAYMDLMLDEHKNDVKLFEKASRSAKDSDVRTFAANTLPTLQMHLQHAQTTRDAVKGKR